MKRPLIYQGGDVRLVQRLPRGQVLVERLHRGEPSGRTASAWPHELRGHPDGLPAIRRMIAALPDRAAEPAPPPTDHDQDAGPRGFLFAHYAAGNDREED